MATERLRQQVEQLLDEAQKAVTGLDWTLVRDRARAALSIDQENADGLALLAIAERELGENRFSVEPASPSPSTPTAQPTSFANGRYEVKRFLGEGGKKKVYLAQDTLLDREVAFALIKTRAWTRSPARVSPARPRPWAALALTPTSSLSSKRFVSGLLPFPTPPLDSLPHRRSILVG